VSDLRYLNLRRVVMRKVDQSKVGSMAFSAAEQGASPCGQSNLSGPQFPQVRRLGVIFLFPMRCVVAQIRSYPGGAHTYAKGDDQYPLLAPGFIARGLGCRVWDADGNAFIEYGMGLRAVALGHAFPAVVAAAASQIRRGANFTRPSPLEVECAENLLEVVPGAEMVKFTKDGSTANTAAVRLARAFTGRDLVALGPPVLLL
jgi:hypothetical protein